MVDQLLIQPCAQVLVADFEDQLAQLPWPKTPEDYDWGAVPDLGRSQIEQLAHDTGWIDRVQNLLLVDPAVWANPT